MRNLANLRGFIGVGLSPRLSFMHFGFSCKFSLIMARPGFGFHRFRLSRGLGFDRFGFPL